MFTQGEFGRGREGCSLGGCVGSHGNAAVMWRRGGEDNDGGVYSGKSTYYGFTILFHIIQRHIKAHHNGPVPVPRQSLMGEEKNEIKPRKGNFPFFFFFL